MTSKPVDLKPAIYTRVAVILHWTIGAFVVLSLVIGYLIDALLPFWRLIVVELHASVGITILLLTVVRVVWRLGHRPPAPLATLHYWERFLASAVHLGLYLAMILMPLSGWALISANPPRGSAGWDVQTAKLPPRVKEALDKHGGLTFWNIADLPLITPLAEIGSTPEGLKPQKRLHQNLANGHKAGGFLLLGLLVLHIAGALKHEWFDGHAALARMSIRWRGKHRGDQVGLQK